MCEFEFSPDTTTLSLLKFESNKRGYGKLLFCSTLRYLKRLGYTRIVLFAVSERGDLTSLLSYYRKMGFRSIRRNNPAEMKGIIDTLIQRCNRVHSNLIDRVSLQILVKDAV